MTQRYDIKKASPELLFILLTDVTLKIHILPTYIKCNSVSFGSKSLVFHQDNIDKSISFSILLTRVLTNVLIR